MPAPLPSLQFTDDEIERGRKLFAGDWRFIAAANAIAVLPSMRGIEIAFAGRSNVGKSSLINALTGRNALARTSHTPGRTQELIFFSGPSRLTLVDMPGYGYAAAAKTKIKAWTELTHAFLFGRTNLARVYLLVDARHGLKPTDAEVLESLDKAAVNYQIVLTKALRPGVVDVGNHTDPVTGKPVADNAFVLIDNDLVHLSSPKVVEDVRKKVRYDLEYLRQRSLKRDLKIIVKTLPSVLFKRRGW